MLVSSEACAHEERIAANARATNTRRVSMPVEVYYTSRRRAACEVRKRKEDKVDRGNRKQKRRKSKHASQRRTDLGLTLEGAQRFKVSGFGQPRNPPEYTAEELAEVRSTAKLAAALLECGGTWMIAKP